MDIGSVFDLAYKFQIFTEKLKAPLFLNSCLIKATLVQEISFSYVLKYIFEIMMMQQQSSQYWLVRKLCTVAFFSPLNSTSIRDRVKTFRLFEIKINLNIRERSSDPEWLRLQISCSGLAFIRININLHS